MQTHLNFLKGDTKCKLNINYLRGTPALDLNEAADGKLLCCWLRFGLVLLLYLYDIRLFEPKKMDLFWILRGLGCVESKNKTSAKRKSTMSSLNPSIIQVDSFKGRADVPLCG